VALHHTEGVKKPFGACPAGEESKEAREKVQNSENPSRLNKQISQGNNKNKRDRRSNI